MLGVKANYTLKPVLKKMPGIKGGRRKGIPVKRNRRQIREIRGQERVGEIRNRGEETGVVEVSNSTAAAEQHNRPVAMMSHLLKIQ